jgi:DUF438 domain-containing protein
MIGELGKELLDVLLETLPLEFSLVDAEDKVLAWNKHATRVFKRPESVVGKDVRNCHPRKSVHLVEAILDEMRAGTREKAEFWIDLEIAGKKEKILIQYHALRDAAGKYLGCLEASQAISRIQSLKGEKRLLD